MKHVISIGINNVSGLTPLNAAASGAKEFADWATSQGYNTTVFTDEGNIPVSQAAIFARIMNIINDKNCEKLVVFFSGHGILKSPSQEIWLLSDARINPNESINLTGSIDNARTTGIPYIVFISDACRILPNELQFTGNGSVIFPICDDANEDSNIDVLYATRPGSPANEYNSRTNSKKFGLFTQAIVEILNGNYPELIWSESVSGGYLPLYYDVSKLGENRSYKSLANGRWEINTVNIENSLKSIVSNKARNFNVSLNQNPDLRIQHKTPKPFLSQFDDDKAKQLYLNAKAEIKSRKVNDSDIVRKIQKSLGTGLKRTRPGNQSFKSILQNLEFTPISQDVYKLKSSLITNSERIFDAKGKESFETQTGFTIVGSEIREVIANCGKDIFFDNNTQQIRIYNDRGVSSALLILKNGQSIPVAVLQGYIGTLVFTGNRLLTINYTPSGNNYKFHDFKTHENEINFVRAFVASAANEGFDYHETFKNEFNQDENVRYDNAGSYLRREKSLDPSLGLYAVYAYRQAGRFKDIESVYEYMSFEADNMLFDVAMLAGKLKNIRTPLSPFCPMFSIGWAYRQRFEQFIHPQILEASNFLVPTLWTTFNTKGTEIIADLFNEKIIQ